MRVERPRDPTPPAPAQAPSTEVKSPSQPLDAATVAQRLLREPASAESPTEVRLLSIGGDGLGTDELRLLAHAVDTGEPVIIDYLSSSGRVTQRTISRADISVGLLTAYCHLRADERYFRVDRIEAVLPAPAG
jgi:predicted DNA-binding transcriptional regulator YafY